MFHDVSHVWGMMKFQVSRHFKQHQISFYSKWLALQRLFLWCLFYCCTYYGDVHAKLIFVAAYLFCKALPFTRTLMAGSNRQVIAQHVLLHNKTTICIGDSMVCHFVSILVQIQFVSKKHVLVLTVHSRKKVEVHGSWDHPRRRLFRLCRVTVPRSPHLIEMGFFRVWGLPMSFHNNILNISKAFWTHEMTWIILWYVWIQIHLDDRCLHWCSGGFAADVWALGVVEISVVWT